MREKNRKRRVPYLPERQWGTVREDYLAGGDAVMSGTVRERYLPSLCDRARYYGSESGSFRQEGCGVRYFLGCRFEYQ